MRTLIMLILALLLTATSAQTLPPQPPPSVAPTPSAQSATTAPKPAVPADAEILALRQQNRLLEGQLQAIKEFQSAILETIYWALGGVFLALSLVFGFSWFTNFKLYDRDKQALQADLHGKIDSSVKELTAAYATSALNLERRVDEKFEEWKRTAEYQAEETTKRIQSNSQATVTALERRVAALQRDTLRIFIRTEANPDQRMTLARSLLYYTLDAAPQEVPEAIVEIRRSLEDGAKLTTPDVASLNGMLDKVLPAHAAFVTKLREHLGYCDNSIMPKREH